MRIGCDRCLSSTPLILFVNPPRIPPQPLLWGLPDPRLELLDYCCCDVEYILLLVSGTRHIHFLPFMRKRLAFAMRSHRTSQSRARVWRAIIAGTWVNRA